MRPVLFVNRRNDSNIGDLLSAPIRYFGNKFPLSVPLEVHLEAKGGRLRSRATSRAREMLRDSARAVVIGGGGLLGNPYFEEDLGFWTGGPAPNVLWGAGHNSHDLHQVAAELPTAADYVQLLPFAAIGLRDWGSGFSWVPCASCMHPELAIVPKRRGNVVFALHRDVREDPARLQAMLRHAPADHDVVFNDTPAEVFIGKLRQAGQVVTNSYHAAYWATLLQTPVVVIGGGTKVRLLKHQPVYATADNWPEALREAQLYPQALEECRDRNTDYANFLAAEYGDKPRAARHVPFVRQPIEERQKDLAATGVSPPALVRNQVPKIIHFIFGLSPDFGGKPFNILHHMAVRSAAERLKPDEIFFHHAHEPDNEFYHRVKHLMTPRKIETPQSYMGRELRHFAHKADIVRMQILQQFGGIYLDLDTVSVGSFDRLLEHSFTMGLQGRTEIGGLCNAVMLASRGDPFVRDWFRHYENFSADSWDRFSVKLPYLMWRSGKYSINVEAFDRFHWPLWTDEALQTMFEQDVAFPNAICHHLWESQSYRKYFTDSSFDEAIAGLKTGRSTYARLVRDFL